MFYFYMLKETTLKIIFFLLNMEYINIWDEIDNLFPNTSQSKLSAALENMPSGGLLSGEPFNTDWLLCLTGRDCEGGFKEVKSLNCNFPGLPSRLSWTAI